MGSKTPENFTLEVSVDPPEVFVGERELEILDVSDDGRVIAECDLNELILATLEKFPAELALNIRSGDGFGTYLFHEATVYVDNGELMVEYICHHPNKYWEGKWGLSTFLGAIQKQADFFPDISVGEIELEDDWKRLTLKTKLSKGAAVASLAKTAELVTAIMQEAEIALGGIRWKPEYGTDERAFCEEVLAPLLRRMGFLSVRYTHGVREYGKDFTFSELTPFGILRHYALQAKAGDVSGGVNSAVDELIAQADDAFRMSYFEISSTEPRYISTFVVAISGNFTANAKEKILQKIPHGIYGSILFLDRESIMELVGRHWATRT